MLNKTHPKRVVWLYDGDHLEHPFIRLAVESLEEVGDQVTVIDRSNKNEQTRYRTISVDLHTSGPDKKSDFKVQKPATTLLGRWRARFVLVRYILLSFWFTSRSRPNVVIATLPLAAFAGWLAARLLGAWFVYYPFELFGEQATTVSSFLKKLELFVIKRADALITQNEMRAQVYKEERGAKVDPVIVHNYKRWKKVPQTGKLRQLLGLNEDVRIVLYEGYLVNGRWLDKLVLSAVHLPENTIMVFLGKIFPWWEQNIQRLLEQPEIASKVRVVPWVQHAEVLEYVADADVGVIIYDDQVRNNYYCEPGKLSDYTIIGIPVVAPNFPTIGPLIKEYGIGALFNRPEPSEIGQVICSVLSIPRDKWRPAFELAQSEFIWEKQFPAFRKAIDPN